MSVRSARGQPHPVGSHISNTVSASCIVEELDSNNNPLDGFTIVSLKFDPVIDSQNNNDSFIANEVKERIDDNRTFAEQVNEEILSHRALMGKLKRVNTYDIVIDPLSLN